MKLSCNDKGFSLVEVLVAISVFAIGLLAVASMQTTSVMGNFKSRATTEGTDTGLGRVEEFLTYPYTHADLTAGAHGPVTEGYYTYSWNVVDNDRLNNTKTVQLSVTFNYRGTTHTTDLVFVKADTI